MSKNEAYAYLAQLMNKDRYDAHVAKFGISDCINALELLKESKYL